MQVPEGRPTPHSLGGWPRTSDFFRSLPGGSRTQSGLRVRKSVSPQPAGLAHQIGYFGQKKLLKRRRKRNGRVGRSQPDNRSIEIVERFFVDDRGNFSGQSPGARVF